MHTAHQRSRVLVVLTLASVALIGCASSRSGDGGGTPLDRGIALYIDGRYPEAIDEFSGLVTELRSDADRQTAYLYLGRSYMQVGDYVGAADAFSSGAVIGDDVRFEHYIAMTAGHLRADPERMRHAAVVTRADLAALIARMFLPDNPAATVALPADAREHWAERYVGAVLEAGYMTALPDGRWHPDEPVTRAVCYLTGYRTAGSIEGGYDVMDVLYPGGYRGIAQPDGLITGADAIRVFEALQAEAGS